VKQAHLLARRSLTRTERKAQIIMVFDLPRRAGKLDGLTAQKVADEIGVLGVDNVRDMLNELVSAGMLYRTRGVHRTLKNGTTIDKFFYWRVVEKEEVKPSYSEQLLMNFF